jgi:hypothetical protein
LHTRILRNLDARFTGTSRPFSTSNPADRVFFQQGATR